MVENQNKRAKNKMIFYSLFVNRYNIITVMT